MNSPLILIANPGSASRKYALFKGDTERAQLHFEWFDDNILCTLRQGEKTQTIAVDIKKLEESSAALLSLFRIYQLLEKDEQIKHIGVRIVAPGGYFLRNHEVDRDFIARFESVKEQAPLHVSATLSEINHLQEYFPSATIIGISDSAFHHTKPDYVWNYGISLEIADTAEIKRFGYHGISVASVLPQQQFPHKTIVCHLGSGASITAVHDGRSLDTTMGYTPLEGVIMSTRSGSIDIGAVNKLKQLLHLDDIGIQRYLNEQSGLKGLGGSSDIRELLRREENGDTRAHLALETFVYTIQKSIGAMAAALNGADAIVFTGTVGERSALIRKRIITQLRYLGFIIDPVSNGTALESRLSSINLVADSKPILIIPTREEKEMAKQTLGFIASA